MEKFPSHKAITKVAQGTASIVDVREEWERSGGYIPGSVHIPIGEIEAGKDSGLAKDRVLFVHCASGRRAERARKMLSGKGFSSVYNIGGLKDWEKAGGSVVREKKS